MKLTENIRGTSICHWPGLFQLGANVFGLNSSTCNAFDTSDTSDNCEHWNICNQLKAYLGLPNLPGCLGLLGLTCMLSCRKTHSCCISIANFLSLLFFDLLCIACTKIAGSEFVRIRKSSKLLKRKRRKRVKRPFLSMRICDTWWMTGKCAFCLWSSTVVLS